MNNRRTVKELHENFHVSNFIKWLNETNKTDYEFIDKPEPPDAIIKSNAQTSWIEISTAFLSESYAKDVMSRVTSNEEHISTEGETFVEPDKSAAFMFGQIVKNKLEKEKYLELLRQFGQGYLVIPIINPFFNESTIAEINNELNSLEIKDLNCFKSITITYIREYVFRTISRESI